LPVESWSQGREGEKKKGAVGLGKKKGGKRQQEEEEEEEAELLDKALREMVKLPSSKMFYKYIKELSGPESVRRVPHYLKKLDDERL